MKIYNTHIKYHIMELIKEKTPVILFDHNGFADGLNAYSLHYMNECYLINQAMSLGLAGELLLRRHESIKEQVDRLVDENQYDYEDAVFVVGMIKEVIDACKWNVEVANIEDVMNTALESEMPMYIHAVAMSYFSGLGVSQDYEKAYQLFKKAYDAGDANCFYYLGLMNAEGLGTEENLPAARSYYLEGLANEADMSHCYYGLALLKRSQGEDYIADLLKSDEPEACLLAGEYFIDKADKEKARQSYHKGAQQLDPECLVRYGKMSLRDGDAKGLDALVYSYYQFNPEATEYLGYLFTQGLYVKQDVQRGFDMLSDASDLGSPKAKELLKEYETV